MEKTPPHRNRKSQMQVSETIFAVIIIIVIIVIGLVFYSKAKEGSIKEEMQKDRMDRLVDLAHTLSSWPELECSVRETREFDCLDDIKLDVLTTSLSQEASSVDYSFNYYYDLIGRAKITVNRIYPPSDKKSWIVYEKKGTSRTEETITIPVSIYNPIEKRYALGVMELKMYE
jgi:hypothetical protein